MTLEEFNQQYYIQDIYTSCTHGSIELNHAGRLFFNDRHNKIAIKVRNRVDNVSVFELEVDDSYSDAINAIRQKFNISIN